MKTKRTSISLKRCLPLSIRSDDFLSTPSSSVSEDLELEFEVATASLSSENRNWLRDWCAHCGLIQTSAHFERMCQSLGRRDVAEKAHAVVRRIGQSYGLERLDAEGVDTLDAVRAGLKLLGIVPESEIDLLAEVCTRYAKEASRPLLLQIIASLRTNPGGAALLYANSLTGKSLRELAKRLGVSHVALFNIAKQIRPVPTIRVNA